MSAQSSVHFYLNWAKERLDEMDATLAVLDGQIAKMQADTRAKAQQFVAQLRARRDEFDSALKKQAQAGEAAWETAKTRLEADWKEFQGLLKEYSETVGEHIDQQRAMFESQVNAQLKAWRETADQLNVAARTFASESRREVDTAITRMKADASAAEQKLANLTHAGNESWSALSAALAETRASFDRANQAARDAFRRAVG
jgi:hypothetical protein